MASELFATLQKTLKEIQISRKQKDNEKNADTSVYLPKEFLKK